MRILQSVFLICFLCSAYGHPVDDGSSATCTDVTIKLVAFLQASLGQTAPMVASTIETATGMQILSVSYLERITCPLLESESIADVGEALRSSGLLRLDVDGFAAYIGVGYSYMMTVSASGQLEAALEYNTPAERALIEAVIRMATHAADMGFMNLNPEGFARMQAIMSMMLSHGPPQSAEPLEPFPGNPGAYNTARRQDILLQDIQGVMDRARVAAGDRWPMIAMIINMYSGGLVDPNSMDSVNSLVRGIAAVDSLDGLYEFVSSTVLMPLLNFYVPQLDMAFRQGERNMVNAAQHMEELLEQSYVTQKEVDEASLRATTFVAFHAAVRATGILNLHW